MKKLDNIVVEVLDLEHGQEVKREFINQSINDAKSFSFTGHKKGDYLFRYYGIIEGAFKDYSLSDIQESKAKIITLEQLKSMQEDTSEYPKLMIVSDKEINESNKGLKRIVIGFCKNSYWAINQNNEGSATRWKYAQDIEETPDPKHEELSVIINGIEYVPKNKL